MKRAQEPSGSDEHHGLPSAKRPRTTASELTSLRNTTSESLRQELSSSSSSLSFLAGPSLFVKGEFGWDQYSTTGNFDATLSEPIVTFDTNQYVFKNDAPAILKRALKSSDHWPQWMPMSFRDRHVNKDGSWHFAMYCSGCMTSRQTTIKVQSGAPTSLVRINTQ